MMILPLSILLLTAILSVSATSHGARTQQRYGIRAGRLTDPRPRRSVRNVLAPAVGFPGDQEYGGRFAPLDKRPFGSLFNMKGLGKRSELQEEESEIIPEEDSALPSNIYQNIFDDGFKLGHKENYEPLFGHRADVDEREYEDEISKEEKRQYGNILGGGYKFGKRGYGGVLGGGYKFGKRGFGGVLGGGYKFGKRGFGGVLGGGYKFGKRSDEREQAEPVSARNEGLEMAKRPWGNLFNKGFNFGKRDNSANALSTIYRAILSSNLGNGRNKAGFQDDGRVMKGAISMAKRLFGNVLGGGYKLG